MKLQYGVMALICLTMGLAMSIHTNVVTADVVRTIGPTGNHPTIQDAINWVASQPTNDYTFNVNSLYSGETYPITIDIRSSLGHQSKTVEIHGYNNMSSYTVLSGTDTIFDITFDLGTTGRLTIDNFDMKVDNYYEDVIYIHDSKNVQIVSSWVGGVDNNNKCGNGIKVLNSQDVLINSVISQMCSQNAIYFQNVNNHDTSITSRGISDCTLSLNNNGIKLEDSQYIRCIDNGIDHNDYRGIYILNSNHNLVTLSSLFCREIKYNDVGIEIKGDQYVCNYNNIYYYDINNNTDYGIYFDHTGVDSDIDNLVNNVRLHNNYYGILISSSYGISIIGDNTKIFYHDSSGACGIKIISSNYINLDFDKDAINDVAPIHDNYFGIWVDTSNYIVVKDLILKDNGFYCLSKKGQIIFDDCNDYEMSGFIYITSPITNGIYIYDCHDGVIENILIHGFDDSSYYGIIIEQSSNIDFEGFTDNDHNTEKPIMIHTSSYVTMKDITFDRSSYSEYAEGIYIKSSDNIEFTRTEGINYLKNYEIGIKMEDCYNSFHNKYIEYFDIEYCGVGISIGATYLDETNFCIDLLYIETDHCEIGLDLYNMNYVGAQSPAVFLCCSYINNSNYGIYMSGSELFMSSTYLYYWDDTGIYNRYYENDQILCGGWLHISDYCVISDPSDDYINTLGKSGAITNTYDYIPVPVEKIIENNPYGYYWNMDSA